MSVKKIVEIHGLHVIHRNRITFTQGRNVMFNVQDCPPFIDVKSPRIQWLQRKLIKGENQSTGWSNIG